jgi:hypothetical protein
MMPKPPSPLNLRAKTPYPTTLKVGAATRTRTGADHGISWIPLLEPLIPRARYHQVPGSADSDTEVEYVLAVPIVRHGLSVRLHCTS